MEEEKKINEAAKELSKLGASRGGIARAKKLTKEERSEIARKAVEARWARRGPRQDLPRATHSGVLRLDAIEIPCHVLEDGRRVLVQRKMINALGMARGGSSKGGGDRLAHFVSGKVLSEFINDDLAVVTREPSEFRTQKGNTAYCYEATILADICDAVFEANKQGKLQAQQKHIAERCEMLMRSFAKVGIIALIDEATGYQEVRERDELHKLLAVYLSEERLRWARTFPDEFYKQIYRLKAWPYPGSGTRRTPLIGKITNDIVYEKLPPGVLPKLRELNPKVESTNRRRWKFFQFLSADIGQPDLRDHLLQLIAIMRAATNWKSFERLLERAFPSKNPKPIQGAIWPDEDDE